jgi:polar amino acid transport system substrate-binding protein
MKQIIQSYKTGEMTLEETPVPQAAAGAVLVETVASLVSAGTEKGKMARMISLFLTAAG